MTFQWAAISVWRQVIWVGSSGGDSAAAWQVDTPVTWYHNSSLLCIQRDNSSQHCPAGCYWRGHWSGVQQRWQGRLWGGGEDQVLPPQPHPRPRQTLHHHRGIVNTSYWRWRVSRHFCGHVDMLSMPGWNVIGPRGYLFSKSIRTITKHPTFGILVFRLPLYFPRKWMAVLCTVR